MKDLGITYPVAIDNNYKVWRALNNQYWPAHYFADAKGQIRYHHFGEGDYAESERVIQQLLREAGAKNVAGGLIEADAKGVQQAPDMNEVQSPETYLGFQRAENFVTTGTLASNQVANYPAAGKLALNNWTLEGQWNVGGQQATLGQAPGDAHGADIAPDGSGTVTEQRLYQLVRQPGAVQDRTFTIEFLDPQVSAYAFTFG